MPITFTFDVTVFAVWAFGVMVGIVLEYALLRMRENDIYRYIFKEMMNGKQTKKRNGGK